MEKTVGGITYKEYKEDPKFLLSKEELGNFIIEHENELVRENWDEIFEYPKNRTGYKLIYTLLSLNIDFLSYITSIPVDLFFGCTFLKSITIPNSVTEIGDGAFFNCDSLISVIIPSSVKKIEGYTFSGCSSLPSILIPSSVTEIRRGAFYGCSSLTSVTIPSSVAKIGSGAFSYCTSLKTLTCSKDLKFDAEKIGLSSSVEIIRV